MQKSKCATIGTIIFIFLYGLLASFKLVKEINFIYLYIINPIFWIGLSIMLYFLFGKSITSNKLQKTIIQYTLIATLVFIIVYMLSGLIITFGKNPYNTTLKGFFLNFWALGSVIIAREYIRFKVIHNAYEKDKTQIAIFISIVFIFIELELNTIMGKNLTVATIAKFFMSTAIPVITENIVFSYIARYSNHISAIIYRLITNLYFWTSPIIPNSPWIMTSIIDTAIPIILFLYIRHKKNKLEIFRNRQNIINSDPKSVIPLVALIIIGIWFATGVFPIKATAIASGSMMKELYVGDIAVIKKCNANDVNVGDIIEYQMEGYTVVHRIIEKKQIKGEFYFVTKGDNNGQPDLEEVREKQLIGKVIFKVKYLGYPAIWIHKVFAEEQTINVDTGR